MPNLISKARSILEPHLNEIKSLEKEALLGGDWDIANTAAFSWFCWVNFDPDSTIGMKITMKSPRYRGLFHRGEDSDFDSYFFHGIETSCCEGISGYPYAAGWIRSIYLHENHKFKPHVNMFHTFGAYEI